MSKLEIQPLGDRVVVRLQPEETKTASGIVLPGKAADQANQGEVIYVGPGRVLDNGEISPMRLKVGDSVLLPQYGTEKVKLNDEELVVVSESDVKAILVEKAD